VNPSLQSATAPVPFGTVIARLELASESVPPIVRDAFAALLDGAWNSTQAAAFVTALRVRGLSAESIAVAAEQLRQRMIPLPTSRQDLLDTCGTGGDGQGSLNLSTGAALICAAAGVKVAKHGNRAASSLSGSADVLEALGVRLDLTPEAEAGILESTGIAFLFAQKHHPALRHVAQARRELGIRTIFNVLGPLCNPARARFQLLGAYDDALRPLLASALRDLGVERAWVVRAEDGLDELSPFTPTRVTELRNGELRERVVTPEDFGLPWGEPGCIQGGPPEENARILQSIFRGEHHPARSAVLLNAAAGLVVAQDLPLAEAALWATRVVDEGKALRTLLDFTAATQRAAGESAP